MIFCTVGGQMPFDRLVRAVDDWAESRGRDDVVAQTGPTDLVTRRVRAVPFLAPPEYARVFEESRAVVSHAGMGTILTALTAGKPLLVLPRRGDLQETRNDHQIATARRFLGREGLLVAMDESELLARLDELEYMPPPARIAREASPELLAAVREFVHRSS